MRTLALPPALVVGFSIGGLHICAIESPSLLFCWGKNLYGQLGDGTLKEKKTPTVVEGMDQVVQVSSGGGYNWGHTCAVTTNGSTYCWGNNKYGQLGMGMISQNETTPRLVPGVEDAVAVSCGRSHTCILMKDGTGKCAGSNWQGQLGTGKDHKELEKSAELLPVELQGMTALVASRSSTCAILSDKTLWCWGFGTYGRLGLGSQDPAYTPSKLPMKGVTSVSLGGHHGCALLDTGKAQCWGSNKDLQLGAGSETVGTLVLPRAGALSPKPLEVDGLSDLVGVTTGRWHSCSLSKHGVTQCWGGNRSGQRGVGPNKHTDEPQKPAGLGKVVEVVAGFMNTCVILEDRTAQCWGSSHNGQTGTGEVQKEVDMPAPVQVLQNIVVTPPDGHVTHPLFGTRKEEL
mmetsp:Transcript_3477/g.7853  ORF Transcript_3477/g.7853 Transcript_3477/m.7853 type:complete len:402 (-) Transcript_3477:85-1290(-)